MRSIGAGPTYNNDNDNNTGVGIRIMTGTTRSTVKRRREYLPTTAGNLASFSLFVASATRWMDCRRSRRSAGSASAVLPRPPRIRNASAAAFSFPELPDCCLFLLEQLGAARSWIEVLWNAPPLPRSAGSAADAELPPRIAFRCLEPSLRGLGCGHGGAGGQSMLHCHGASSALVDAHWSSRLLERELCRAGAPPWQGVWPELFVAR